MLHLLVFDIIISFAEFLTQNLFQSFGIVELVETFIQADRQRMRIAIRRAFNGLRWLDALDHAEVATGKRSGEGQIGVGIGSRHAIFDPRVRLIG